MVVIGIDPGMKGGFAYLSEKTFPQTFAWDDLEFRQRIKMFAKDPYSYVPEADMPVCYIEKVHSMPGQGVASTFKFGKGYGYCLGVLDAFGIRFVEVTPQKWKKHFDLIGKDKKASIAKCQELFPDVNLLATSRSRVPADGMAEALLIAAYGLEMELQK